MSADARRRSFQPMQLLTHLSIAGTAIVVLLVLGSIDPGMFATLRGNAETGKEITQIGLEFDQPISVEMLFARKGKAGYVSIANTSGKMVKISVPEQWTRTEVRGKPISRFSSEPPELGFRRWTMPPQSGMSMLLPAAPAALRFLSPSQPTAAITLRSVDVASGEQFINVVLLKNEVEARLWEE